MNTPPNREVVLFSAALELPASQRAAYLDEACADDPALRLRLETLLQLHGKASAFLETPASDEHGYPIGTAAPDATARLGLTPAEKVGDRIDRYKLLQQIGEGGCGIVYMAEQEEPIRRRVALKIIKLGMDTRQVIARFEAERQVLALMDHPHIAKVFDAGATATGRPFFVMELVRGIRITDFCDQHQMATADRLKLFIQVCQAIQHAHQKGIIHRDIKPSNILVTNDDGLPIPKVIDFGIAKATQGRLTDKTLFTAFEQFMGTPAYMSPEQAAMTSLDVDTRSDIYSLGVLLHELLTGQTPFKTGELLASGLDGMRRTIREKEPKLVSTHLSTLTEADLAKVSNNRQAAPLKLIHLVRGDLDWVVAKALEKDRARRYATVTNLALDVQRHLDNEPVAARPPSGRDRFQKLVIRNKLAFAAAIAVAVSAIIGLCVSSWSLLKEKEARQRALSAEGVQRQLRRDAQLEAARSREVARFLEDMLQEVGPSKALGRDTTMLQDILDKTAARVGQDLTNEPVVEAELQTTIGEVYLLLGDFTKAEAMQRAALAIRRRLWGDEHLAVAESLDNLARVLHNRRLGSQAEAMQRQALALRKKLLGGGDPMVAASLQNLALTLQVSKPAEAESLLREALAIDRKAWGENDPRLNVLMRNLALVLDISKLEEAETMASRSVAVARKSPGKASPDLAQSLRILAHVLVDDKGKLAEAEQAAREALAINRQLRGKPNPTLADSLNELAWVLYRRNKWAEAETSASEALAIHHELQPNDLDDGFALNTLALLHMRTGRWKAAAADFKKLAELEPANDFVHFALAALSFEVGDLSGYRIRCGIMVSAFGGSSDPAKLDKTAKVCLLSPEGGFDLQAVGRLADRAVTLGKDSPYLRFFEFAKGLADFRLGQFVSATDGMRKVIEADKTAPAWNCELAAYSVLAMAHQKLRHSAEARGALAQALEISNTKLPQIESGDLGEDSQDWLIAHILLREAKALIDPHD